ncbi:hypothetical protein [Viridibacillus arvi]|uniref:hypothetical protein n=1 Tax=Viridibacillus arvi TaxID=263475 RepID=UPI00187B7B6A|nr:hypothetical protein [Viridibacillus sp. JNUCC-6]QOV10933.1 hypothetical protein JNUCC6_20585 [Viridibacillus sp. JNUCC-6]
MGLASFQRARRLKAKREAERTSELAEKSVGQENEGQENGDVEPVTFTTEQLEGLTNPQIEDILTWIGTEFKSKQTKSELIALVLGEEQPKAGE